jgi:large subunit ribosomal protein L6
MSRIGKKPVQSRRRHRDDRRQKVVAKGPKGELSFVANDEVSLKLEDNAIVVTPWITPRTPAPSGACRATMVSNILTGVKDGYERKLEINGVGYRAAMQGQNLQLALGFSHDVVYQPPKGVNIACPKPTEIVITGIDKQVLGQVAAEIRAYRSPEPYKGKGVKYAEERIVRKEGKKK